MDKTEQLKQCPNPECNSTNIRFNRCFDLVYAQCADCNMRGPAAMFDDDMPGLTETRRLWNLLPRKEDVK